MVVGPLDCERFNFAPQVGQKKESAGITCLQLLHDLSSSLMVESICGAGVVMWPGDAPGVFEYEEYTTEPQAGQKSEPSGSPLPQLLQGLS